jgi:hypothetical protein
LKSFHACNYNADVSQRNVNFLAKRFRLDNRRMLKLLSLLFVFSLAGLGACSPALNWREVGIKDTDLVAMLPCKPDVGERLVPLGGKEVALHMTGCDADGATFAVAHARLAQGPAAPAVLAQWRAATLANMGASSSREEASRLPLLAGVAGATTLWSARGQRRDGTAVVMQGVWFARGADVFHAVVYADDIPATLTEAFFPGLRLR